MNVRTTPIAVTAKPPFRAEHIGSLLRPSDLLRQRARFAAGEISAAELGRAEDEAIAEAVRMQEQIGFKFVTDANSAAARITATSTARSGNCVSTRSVAPRP